MSKRSQDKQDSAIRIPQSAISEEVLPEDPRTRARWLAVQGLYEWDTSGHDALVAVEHRLEDEPDTARVAALARTLVNGVRDNQAGIDEVLARTAPQWPLEQMAVVDRNILRVAVFEVLFDNRTPVRAAVNEAVELAKTFGSESSARFVNGVLGAVAAMATR